MAFGVSLNVDNSKALAKLRRRKGRLSNLSEPAKQIARFGEREARDRLAERPVSWFEQTGRLRSSINSDISEDGTIIRIGSNLRYARLQELGSAGLPGGVVLPLAPRKLLAIPANQRVARSGDWPRDYAAGELKFVRVAEINIAGRHWIGPALIRPFTEKQAERRKEIKANQRKRRKKGLRGSVIQAALRKKKDLREIGKRVEWALVKSARIPAGPYLKAVETVRNITNFAKDRIKAFLLG